MTTILTPTAEHEVAAHDGLWMSPADAEKATGWTLKPEGMCRADAGIGGEDLQDGPLVALPDRGQQALGRRHRGVPVGLDLGEDVVRLIRR